MISFIIPAKNEEHYISDCIDSILKQKIEEPIEIIVVDNNSTDTTAEVISRRFVQVKCLSEPIAGTNSARQRGFEYATGEIVVFVDADVRLPAGWTHKVVRSLRAENRLVAISGTYRFYDFAWYWNWANEIFTFLITYPVTAVLNHTGWVAQMQGGCMAIKRNAFLAVHGFDTSFTFYGDDTATAMRLKKIGRVVFSPRFWVHASARRYNKRGVIYTLSVYLLNLFSIWFFNRPYHGNADIVR